MKNILKIFLVIFLFSCENQENINEPITVDENENVLNLKDEQLQTFELTSVEIQEKSMSQTLRLNGIVEVTPQNLVSVSSAFGGYLKSTKLQPGLSFKKGEVIAVLENDQFIQLQQEYLTTIAQLKNAEEEYNRQKKLNESKASSDKVFQQAKADYEILKINKKALEEKLRLIHINPAQVSINNLKRSASIYAPFDGFVTQVFVNTGRYISPSDVLFEIINPKNFLLKLKVFEKDISKIKIGQSAKAYTNNNPNEIFHTEISIINKNIGGDRSMNAYASFKGNYSGIFPGMYMNAEILIPENKTFALPEESVLNYQGKNYVFEILDTHNFQLIEIQTGNTSDHWIEILNPEQLIQKKIAQKGAYTLLMALKNTSEE